MKDEKFNELVSLYLDHEISPHDLSLLQAELSTGKNRLDAFQSFIRLRAAEQRLFAGLRAAAQTPKRVWDSVAEEAKCFRKFRWGALVVLAVAAVSAGFYFHQITDRSPDESSDAALLASSNPAEITASMGPFSGSVRGIFVSTYGLGGNRDSVVLHVVEQPQMGWGAEAGLGDDGRWHWQGSVSVLATPRLKVVPRASDVPLQRSPAFLAWVFGLILAEECESLRLELASEGSLEGGDALRLLTGEPAGGVAP